jgi:hypothetical protein
MKWVFFILLGFFFAGCASSNFGTCALHTSLSCSMQSIGACPVSPTGDQDWEAWGMCLASSAAVRCPSGLARCAVSAMLRSKGPKLVAGGTGCDTDAAKACVDKANPTNEDEAIEVVADCFREVCASE